MYMPRFALTCVQPVPSPVPVDLPGPTGESNRLSTHPRGPIACLGPDARTQADVVRALGGIAIIPRAQARSQASTTLGGTPDVASGEVPAEALITLECAAVIYQGDTATARTYEMALAQRAGPITPLVTGPIEAAHVLHERHVCIDTTAAGGNAALLADVCGLSAS